jgi:hypothetical protein
LGFDLSALANFDNFDPTDPSSFIPLVVGAVVACVGGFLFYALLRRLCCRRSRRRTGREPDGGRRTSTLGIEMRGGGVGKTPSSWLTMRSARSFHQLDDSDGKSIGDVLVE